MARHERTWRAILVKGESTMTQPYNDWRMYARVFAVSLIGLETILNATANAASGILIVAPTIVLTLAGAMTIPLARRSWAEGQRTTAIALVALFLPLVIAISFTSSLDRMGHKMDAAVTARTHNEKIETTSTDVAEMARNAYERACGKTQAERDTKKGNTACNRAQRAYTKAAAQLTEALSRAEANAGDVVAKRLAALLAPIGISEDAVTTYLPMVWPLALLIGGFIMADIGWGGQHNSTPEPPRIKTTEPAPASPKRESKRKTKQDALKAILTKCRDGGGALNVRSQTELAILIGVPKSSLSLWVTEWGNGPLNIERTDQGIKITPAQLRAVNH
jgi:hypothetical protein